jgi:glycosyltransferase involved in cell wall biosynthesis
MKNSLPASLLAFFEAKVWNAFKLQKYTSKFICPSLFIRQKMIEGGFCEDKLLTVNNFLNMDDWETTSFQKENYYCYVGRLSVEKGIETLLKAAIQLPEYPLKVVGSGPLMDDLRKNYSASHIEFCGQKTSTEVKSIVSKAAFMVLPSECYENNPLSVIEALCMGTPVIGANIGGIPELITENENGLLFNSGDVSDLQTKINNFFTNQKPVEYKQISLTAKKRFSSDVYYDKLLNLYNQCITKN